MDRELFLECPRGVNCGTLRKVLQELSGQGKEFDKEEGFEQELEIKLNQAVKIVRSSKLSEREKQDAIESLMDCATCLKQLGISQMKLNTLGEGVNSLLEQGESAEIRKLIEESKLQVEFLQGEGELLTLPAVAFLSSFAVSEKFSGSYLIRTSVCEGGNYPVGAVLLERKREVGEEEEKRDEVCVLETNVDDCSGEQLGYAIECLMNAGALDASCFPIYMKKHRPAYMLQVICKPEKQKLLEDIIFRETTSIGLRRYEEKRRILPRTFQEVVLKDGHQVRIKICRHHGQNFCYPEYETVKKVCLETGRPYRSVYDEAAAIAGGMV